VLNADAHARIVVATPEFQHPSSVRCSAQSVGSRDALRINVMALSCCAETAMASVNCGAANVTRAQAEKMLDDYFTRVEQAIPWTEINPLDRRL
jgi:hypothetical protein